MSQDKAELVEILRQMILIREFDLLAVELRTAKRIYGALHPYVGEEAWACYRKRRTWSRSCGR